MSDASLMEADCIHGKVWFECEECTRGLKRSGVYYCLEHCGIANEDDLSMCDFYERAAPWELDEDTEPEDCRFVNLYFDPKETPRA